ncbi:MAG: alanine--tRNA ligase, partial [Cyanobacteria bacterium]|nr:alanine--tRNA ligase [Cyanobacteriota bacterium]
LKMIVEKLSQLIPSYLIVLATAHEGKAHFISGVSKDFIEKGIQAGDLVKKAAILCGGSGGGRPNFAQAGGKDPSQLHTALEHLSQEVKAKIQIPTA